MTRSTTKPTVRGTWRLRAKLIALCAICIIARSPNALAGVTFDGRELPLVSEVYRNRDKIHPPYTRIEVNRMGQMATKLTLSHSGGNMYGVLQYSPSFGAQQIMLPTEDRIGWLSWSNAGAALNTLDEEKVYHLPFGGNYEELFELELGSGTIGAPIMNDAGVVAFASRDRSSYPLRDLWLRAPGHAVEPLPDLYEYGLRWETLIDDIGRVIQTHEFRENDVPGRQLMRFTQGVGWENLTENVEEEIFGIIGGQPVNARGDFIFASVEGTPNGVNYWLNLFDTGTHSSRRLIRYSGDFNEVRASVADNGDALLVLRTPYDLDAFRYNAEDGSLTDLATLLRQGQSLTLHDLPYMNQQGDIVLGATSRTDLSQNFSYHFLRANSGQLASIDPLEGLSIHEYALSNSGQMYFWLYSLQESFVGVLNVPEANAMLLAFIGLAYVTAVRRAR
jgi:hypothetical protein